MSPVLRGEFVELRPSNSGDVEVLVAWLNDPAVYHWWGGMPMSREEVQQKYIGTRRPSVESYIIEENRLPVGYIQSCQASDSSCAIDIFLDPAMRGRGLGTDAVCTLSEFLTGVEGCRRITADPEAGNIHALSFWQRLGFLPSDHTTEEGNLELTFVPLN